MKIGMARMQRLLYIVQTMIYISMAERMSHARFLIFVSLGASLAALAGCVRREMTITSEPSGALVYLNGEEAGRTPMTRDFTWYGTYDVVIRKEGSETLRARQKTIAPWWQWPPFDLVAELFLLDDKRTYQYTLQPAADTAIDVDAILARSDALRGQLESTRAPSTQPSR